jgi:hypothetical protein
MVEQAFAVAGNNSSPTMTHSGGTSRYLFTTNDASLGIRDASSSTTFTGTISASLGWGGGATVLSQAVTPGPRPDASGGFPPAVYSATTTYSFTGPAVTAGADVFVDIMVDRTTTTPTVKYDGATMTLVNSVTGFIASPGSSGNSTLFRFHITGVAGGAKTYSFNLPTGSSFYVSGALTSFTGVTSVGTTAATAANGTAPSQAVTCSAGQIILQTFGAANYPAANYGVTGGGAILWDSANMTQYGSTLTQIADTTTTFGITDTSLDWGGLATVLS